MRRSGSGAIVSARLKSALLDFGVDYVVLLGFAALIAAARAALLVLFVHRFG
jgi:hypothetical protein